MLRILKYGFLFIVFTLLLVKTHMAQPRYELVKANVFFENIYNIYNNLLVDAQPTKDFEKKHIDKAINLPNKKRLIAYIDTINTNTPILIYCLSDVRSREAAKFLYEKGFCNVYVLQGGLSAWIEKGYPVISK